MAAKVLVIDNHPDTLDIVKLTLRRQGYDVLTADSGDIGLQIAQRESPDLILLDIMMPIMDGLEVCRRIRANAALKMVPVIMFTAMSRPEDKLAGFAAGADDYLSKPTRPNELIRRVKTILARSGIEADPDGPAEEQAPPAHYAAPAMAAEWPSNDLQLYPDDPVPPPPIDDDMDPAKARIVAVLGVCGGVGTTTMAINVAVTMADEHHETALVDLDQAQGHIALHLGWKKPGGLNTLSRATDTSFLNTVEQELIVYGSHLRLLLAEPSVLSSRPLLNAHQVELLIDSVHNGRRSVVADLGRGLSDANLAFLGRATDILVCLRPDRVAILAAKQLVAALREDARISGVIRPYLMTFTGRSSFPLPVIEDFINHPVADELNIQSQSVTKAVNKGLPLVRLDPNAEFTRKFQNLSRQLLVLNAPSR